MFALRYLVFSAGSPARPNWQMNLGTTRKNRAWLGCSSRLRAKARARAGARARARARAWAGARARVRARAREMRASSKNPSLTSCLKRSTPIGAHSGLSSMITCHSK